MAENEHIPARHVPQAQALLVQEDPVLPSPFVVVTAPVAPPPIQAPPDLQPVPPLEFEVSVFSCCRVFHSLLI